MESAAEKGADHQKRSLPVCGVILVSRSIRLLLWGVWGIYEICQYRSMITEPHWTNHSVCSFFLFFHHTVTLLHFFSFQFNPRSCTWKPPAGVWFALALTDACHITSACVCVPATFFEGALTGMYASLRLSYVNILWDLLSVWLTWC